MQSIRPLSREDYVAAAALRDELSTALERDPAPLASSLRAELAELVPTGALSTLEGRGRHQRRVVFWCGTHISARQWTEGT